MVTRMAARARNHLNMLLTAGSDRVAGFAVTLILALLCYRPACEFENAEPQLP